MKKKLLVIILPFCFTSCATWQAVEPAARFLAQSAVIATANYYGLSPDSAKVLGAVEDSLWGALEKHYQQQPIASGASNPVTGEAIATAAPASGLSTSLVQAAISYLK